MFPDRILISNPRVIIRIEVPPRDFTFIKETREGDFYLVMPTTAREILYLQMLGKNIDVFVPREGVGLLVKCTAIDTL